jgi:hypothetical protein
MRLAAVLALNAKPHAQCLHRSIDAVANAIEDAKRIAKAARTLDRWALLQCNGIERWDEKSRQRIAGWSEADEAACEKAIAKARVAIERVLHDYRTERAFEEDTHVVYNRDPRGCAVKIGFKSGHRWYS